MPRLLGSTAQFSSVAGALAFAVSLACHASPAAEGAAPLESDWHPVAPADLSELRELPTIQVIDLSSSAPACPEGAWSGTVQFVNAGGARTLYKGTGFGCTTQGFGWMSMPNGGSYFGELTTYVRGSGRLQHDEMRPLIREGMGGGLTAGKISIGRYSRDVLVEDRSDQPGLGRSFGMALSDVLRAMAPTRTPAVIAFLEGRSAPVVSTSEAPVPRAASATQRESMENVAATSRGRLYTRADTTAESSTPIQTSSAGRVAGPHELPAPIARLSGVSFLAQALMLYGDVSRPISRNDWDIGVFTTCGADDSAPAQWKGAATLFEGRHAECYPNGPGRTRDERGAGWPWVIGDLQPARMNDCGLLGCDVEKAPYTAEPAGLVEIRWDSGVRQFLEVAMGNPPSDRPTLHLDPAEDSRVVRMLGSAWPDGTVVVNDIKGNWSGRLRFKMAQVEVPGVLYRPDGWTARATFLGEDPVAGAIALRSPDGVVEIQGQLAKSGGDRALNLIDWVTVVLAQPWQGLPVGSYRFTASKLKWQDAPRRLASMTRQFRPANAATQQAAAQRPAECSREPDLVPPGWVVWWPACSVISEAQAMRAGIPAGGQAVTVLSPDGRLELHYTLDVNGRPGPRQLREFNLERGREPVAGMTRSWTSSGLSLRGGTLVIEGEGELREFIGSDQPMYAYVGAFVGLTPQGPGLCGKPTDEGGGAEPCTYANGRRVDEHFHLRAQRYALAAERRELEKQLQRERNQRRANQQAQAAAAEEAEQQARRRRKQQQQEDEDANFHNSMMAAIGGLKQTFDQGAAQMEANNRQIQANLNQAARQAQLQQQQAARPSDGGGSNREAQLQARLQTLQQREQQQTYQQPRSLAAASQQGIGQAATRPQQAMQPPVMAPSPPPARQPEPVETVSRPWRAEAVNEDTEGEARSSVQRQIQNRDNCYALAGQTSRVIADPSSIMCRASGIQVKKWSCSVAGQCQITGRGLSRPTAPGQGSAQ